MHRHRIAIADKTFRHLELRIKVKANSGTDGDDDNGDIDYQLSIFLAISHQLDVPESPINKSLMRKS
jgi:hypothetical protein